MSLPPRRDPDPEARESPAVEAVDRAPDTVALGDSETPEPVPPDPPHPLDPLDPLDPIDAFCAELLAALTELGRRPSADTYRSRARLN